MLSEESMAPPSGIVQYDLMVCQECVGGGQGEGAAYDVHRQNKENGLKIDSKKLDSSSLLLSFDLELKLEV